MSVPVCDSSDEEASREASPAQRCLPWYKSSCCHGAPFPTEAGVSERSRLAEAFASKRVWRSIPGDLTCVTMTLDDVPAVVHPQCERILQSTAIDRLSRGDARGARQPDFDSLNVRLTRSGARALR